MDTRETRDIRNESKIENAIRWILVLPLAILAGWVSWFGVGLLNRITFYFQGINPDSLFSRMFIEAISNGLMGAASVYVGARVAPKHKRTVVFILAVLSILAAGFLLFPAIMTRSGWAIYAIVCWIIGSGAVTWSIYSGELKEFD